MSSHMFCKASCVSSLIFWCILAIFSPVHADGLLDSVDGLAEDYLVEYIAGRDNVPRNLVFVGRGFETSFRKTIANVQEVELWAIEILPRKKGTQYYELSAMCRRDLKHGVASLPIWEQTLVSDGRRSYRRTTTGTVLGMNSSEKADAEEGTSVTRRSMPMIDPYFLPLLDTAAYLRSRNGMDFGVFLTSNCELVSAKREDDGILGVWSLPTKSQTQWTISILFSSKQGNMPTRVEWEVSRKPEVDRDGNPAHQGIVRSQMTSRTKWEKIESRDEGGKTVKGWVPRTISRIDAYSGDDFTEGAFCFQWKQFDDKLLPKPTDEDWRLTISEEFEIDWDESFQSFSRRHNVESR